MTRLRTKQMEGDFRRQPKTSDYCVYCQRDLKPGQLRHWIRLTTDGGIVHPEDIGMLTEADWGTIDMGVFPVGADCAKAIGREWLLPLAAAPTPETTP